MAGYFVHESSYIDENVTIGEGTKIWHFCHVQSGAVIGKNCTLGQNVNISNNVKMAIMLRYRTTLQYMRVLSWRITSSADHPWFLPTT